MVQSKTRMTKKLGLPPGTLMHVGEKWAESVRITVIDYDGDRFHEEELSKIEDCYPYKETRTTTWINISGIHDMEVIEKLGTHFGIHPLFLEDATNTGQRPMLEDAEAYIFMILKNLSFDKEALEINSEHVSLVLGENYIISFEEKEDHVFDIIRNRLRKETGRIRKAGADYLAYTLVDAIVDHYFIILEEFCETIDRIEEQLIDDSNPDMLKTIHQLKRDLIFLRRSVWPLREIINGLERSESSLIDDSTGIYLRDVCDHTIQVIDTIETYRDVVTGMLEIYMTSISNRMNQVMRVLTVIATIFIPLTFIAGIYGMNFDYMPELHWRLGYYAVLIFMVIVGVGMGVYFKTKKWL